MATKPKDLYPTRIDTSDVGYPYGKAQNVTTSGDGTGTPWEKEIINDLFGFQQALLAQGGVTPNGTPDKVGSSQYVQAIQAIIVSNLAPVAQSLNDTINTVGLHAGRINFHSSATMAATWATSHGVVGMKLGVCTSEGNVSFWVITAGTANGIDLLDVGDGKVLKYLPLNGRVDVKAIVGSEPVTAPILTRCGELGEVLDLSGVSVFSVGADVTLSATRVIQGGVLLMSHELTLPSGGKLSGVAVTGATITSENDVTITNCTLQDTTITIESAAHLYIANCVLNDTKLLCACSMLVVRDSVWSANTASSLNNLTLTKRLIVTGNRLIRTGGNFFKFEGMSHATIAGNSGADPAAIMLAASDPKPIAYNGTATWDGLLASMNQTESGTLWVQYRIKNSGGNWGAWEWHYAGVKCNPDSSYTLTNATLSHFTLSVEGVGLKVSADSYSFDREVSVFLTTPT